MLYTIVYTNEHTDVLEWDKFIIPNGAHSNFSEGAGDLIFSALVAIGVRSKTSKFEDQSMFGLINRRSQTLTFPIH